MIKTGGSDSMSFKDEATATPIRRVSGTVSFKPKGYVDVKIIRLNGDVEQLPRSYNDITDDGFQWIAKKLYDSSRPTEAATGPANIIGLSRYNSGDIEESTTSASVRGSDVGNPIAPGAADTDVYNRSNNTMTLTKTFTNGTSASSAQSGIRTLTLYTSTGSGRLLVHGTRLNAAFALNGGDKVEVTWNIVLSEPTP